MRRRGVEGLLDWSLPLFTGLGIPVRLHWTFFVPLIFFATEEMKLAGELGGSRGLALLWTLAHTAGLFALVLAHEYGHALAARSQGLRVREIVLTPLGGLARIAGAMPGPRTDLFVAAAGPAVNLFVIVPTFLLMLLLGRDPAVPAFFGGQVLPFLFFTNLALAAFNLLPAFPMDGGRMLAAALSLRMRPAKAFVIASSIGYVFGALFMLAGLYFSAGTSGWLLFFIGLSNVQACHALRSYLAAGGMAYSPSARTANLDRGGLDEGEPPFDSDELFGEDPESQFSVGIAEARERSRAREEERAVRRRVDELLDKVRRLGTVALSAEEREFLRAASLRFRRGR